MLTRELAEKVLKELAVSMYEYCINDLKLNQEQAMQKSLELYNHSLVVGKIAEKIGREIGLDFDKCYILGLLHDIGRFKPNRSHSIVGYEIAMENNFPELAKICITHTFAKDKKIRKNEFPDNEFKEKDIQKVREILEKLEYNDYDLLIRLCDFMSTGKTIYSSTIDDRLLDLQQRYNMKQTEYDNLKKELYAIKKYFDLKLGYDLYELLELVVINI